MLCSIKVGVRFYPNTTLQLRNPENLSQQSTSSRISVYFKTEQKNGFILYLGNEKDTQRKLRRTKSVCTFALSCSFLLSYLTLSRPLFYRWSVFQDDYLALVLENGYPVLIVDLGSKPQRFIVDKFVADGNWYQAIIERLVWGTLLTFLIDRMFM